MKEISCKSILANLDRFIQFVWSKVFYRAEKTVPVHNFILEHEFDRPGVYDYVKKYAGMTVILPPLFLALYSSCE
jgi:hypothetical protein